jgi:L-asparaginase II
MHKCEIVAKVYRGEREESVHFGAVVVVDINGRLMHYVGDPDFFTYTRSAAKPFQIIPLIRSGAADSFGFSDKQLAVMCGSHSGTDDHAQTVRANLALAGNDESHLRCGTHPPIHYTTENRLPLADDKFMPAQHNCSGKHSGFLALARFLGDDPQKYLEPSSNTQRMVLDAVAETHRYSKEKIKIGIDGCSAPNFGMPLRQTACAFAGLANLVSENPATRLALERVRRVMMAHPEMVSGDGRFDLALARTFPGRVVKGRGGRN